MIRLVLYCMLSLLLADQTVAEECQQTAQQGCTVNNGHAQCESWNLTASINMLPLCITSITFSLIKNPSSRPSLVHVKLNEANFKQFTNLEELEIYTNHGNYSYTELVARESSAFVSLKNIKVLRLRLLHFPVGNVNKNSLNMYSNLKSLKILDLTRSKKIGLDGAKHIIGSKSSIKKLILKDIQDMSWYRTYTPSADLLHFVCQSKVQHLDLSYNDIAYVSFFSIGSKSCSSELKYLNFDNNIIAGFASEASTSNSLSFLYLSSLETLRAKTLNDIKYGDDLWNNDDEDYDENQENKETPELEAGNTELATILRRFDNAPLAFFC